MMLNPMQDNLITHALRRLLFLSAISAWQSMPRLAAYRNAFSGQKAVILCNGPSLNQVDFDSLDGVFCFGLNKINLLFERTPFRPSAIVAVNRLVIEQNADFYEQTDIPVFLNGIRARSRVAFQNNHINLCCFEGGFSKNPQRFVAQGGTVTYVALQLAYFMGFTQVALVGCDHDFPVSGVPHETLRGENEDQNHFDSRYFANQAWHAPDLAMSEASYAKARHAFEADGRRVVNASTHTKLDIFERISLDAFLGH